MLDYIGEENKNCHFTQSSELLDYDDKSLFIISLNWNLRYYLFKDSAFESHCSLAITIFFRYFLLIRYRLVVVVNDQ